MTTDKPSAGEGTALSDLLQGATISASGTDVTIFCSDHETKDAIFNALESAQNWHEEAVIRERFRCIALCDGWIGSFKDREIKYVGAREYAIDAIRDIMDLISDGQPAPRPPVAGSEVGVIKIDEWELAQFLCEDLAFLSFAEEASRTKYLEDAKAIIEFCSALFPPVAERGGGGAQAGVMRASEKAAETVASWSPAKQAYAARVTSPPTPETGDGSDTRPERGEGQ